MTKRSKKDWMKWRRLVSEQARSGQGVKAFCREHIAPYKVPSRWEFVTDLPKSAIGKVLRRKLRERELESAKTATGAT